MTQRSVAEAAPFSVPPLPPPTLLAELAATPLQPLLLSLLAYHRELAACVLTLASPVPEPPSACAHLAGLPPLQALEQLDAFLAGVLDLAREHQATHARVVTAMQRVREREEQKEQAIKRLAALSSEMEGLVNEAQSRLKAARRAMDAPLPADRLLSHATLLGGTTSAPPHVVAQLNSSSPPPPGGPLLGAGGPGASLPFPTEAQLRSGALGAKPPSWRDFGSKKERREEQEETAVQRSEGWNLGTAVEEDTGFDLDL